MSNKQKVLISMARKISISHLVGKYFSNELERKIGDIQPLATMGIDNAIDEGKYESEYYPKCKELIKSIWEEKKVTTTNKYEDRLLHDVSYLKAMGKSGFKYSETIYKEWLKSFEIGYKKANTRGKILAWDEIRELTTESGCSLVATTLYFALPELDEKDIRTIASEFGPIVKEADNLADVYQDAEEGYIKVPIKYVSGIEYSNGIITKIDLKAFKVDSKYIQDRFIILDTKLWEADQRLMGTVSNKEVDKKMLALLRFRAFSWLLNVKDVHEF